MVVWSSAVTVTVTVLVPTDNGTTWPSTFASKAPGTVATVAWSSAVVAVTVTSDTVLGTVAAYDATSASNAGTSTAPDNDRPPSSAFADRGVDTRSGGSVQPLSPSLLVARTAISYSVLASRLPTVARATTRPCGPSRHSVLPVAR